MPAAWSVVSWGEAGDEGGPVLPLRGREGWTLARTQTVLQNDHDHVAELGHQILAIQARFVRTAAGEASTWGSAVAK